MTVQAISAFEYQCRVGDGGTPTETFAHKFMINTDRALNVEAQTTGTTLVNTANPGGPNTPRNRVVSVAHSFSGSGVFHKTDEKFYLDWIKSGLAKNMKIGSTDVGAETITGAFFLTSFSNSGSDKDVMSASMSFVQRDGVANTTNL